MIEIKIAVYKNHLKVLKYMKIDGNVLLFFFLISTPYIIRV